MIRVLAFWTTLYMFVPLTADVFKNERAPMTPVALEHVYSTAATSAVTLIRL